MKKRKLADWLLTNGVAFAYSLLISLALGIFAIGLLVAVVFAAWWERIR